MKLFISSTIYPSTIYPSTQSPSTIKENYKMRHTSTKRGLASLSNQNNQSTQSTFLQHLCTGQFSVRIFLLSLLACFMLGSTSSVHALNAQNLVFFFHNNSGLLDAGTHFDANNQAEPYALESVELSMEALLDGVSENAKLNGGSDGFGINSDGGSDQTQRIDNSNGLESIEFSFNTAGILQTIDLRYIEESADEAILSFAGGNTFHLNTSTALSGQDDFTINEAFSAGQKISLSISPQADLNENFSLEAIHVQIPENNRAIFGIGAAIFLIVFFSRLRKV